MDKSNDIQGTQEQRQVSWPRLRKAMRKIRDGKFFPRRFFVKYWSVLLTLAVLSMASVAHRNMYLIQLNKIARYEEELVDCRTQRILLEEEYVYEVCRGRIDARVGDMKMPLAPTPEAWEEIVIDK